MQICPKRQAPTLEWMMNDDEVSNSWVVSGPLWFYVRKSHITTVRRRASVIKPCLMVANVNVARRGSAMAKHLGLHMLAFMKDVEANAVRFGYAGVYVECVYNTRLHRPLTRGGYLRLRTSSNTAPCFFKPAACMQSAYRRGTTILQTLEKPSLRRFLYTPDVKRFWLRDQTENVIMLVRKDVYATSPMSNCMRLTMLDVHRHRVVDTVDHTGHALCWPDDEACIIRLLRKLETRLVRAGFHELALSFFVSDLRIRAQRDMTTANANAQAARQRLQSLGFSEARDSDGGRIYLKTLSASHAGID